MRWAAAFSRPPRVSSGVPVRTERARFAGARLRRLGHVIRDIRRRIDGNAELQERFGHLLDLAAKVRFRDQRRRGPKVFCRLPCVAKPLGVKCCA